MRHAIAIKEAAGICSAYLPDLLSGVVTWTTTTAEVEFGIPEAIAFHVEGLREDGLPIPVPPSRVDEVEVAGSFFAGGRCRTEQSCSSNFVTRSYSSSMR